MKEVEIFELDENDEKVVEAFVHFDISKNEAKILIYLLHKKEGISKVIERSVGLRQPKVSIGMNNLVLRGLIQRKFNRVHKKGRPNSIYSLEDFKKLKEFIVGNADKKSREMAEYMRIIEDAFEDFTG